MIIEDYQLPPNYIYDEQLKILEEKEYLTHPMAQHLDWKYFNLYFGACINAYLSSHYEGLLMQTNYEQVLDSLSFSWQLSYNFLHWDNDFNQLLCIVFAFPDVRLEQLRQDLMARGHLLDPIIFFRLALVTNQTHQLEALVLPNLTPSAKAREICRNHYVLFRELAYLQHFEAIRYLVETTPEHVDGMLSAENYQGLRAVVADGHLALFDYLLTMRPEQGISMLLIEDGEALCQAAAGGYLELVERICEWAPGLTRQLLSVSRSPEGIQREAIAYAPVWLAASHGHRRVLEYWLRTQPDEIFAMFSAGNDWAVRQSLTHGQLDCFDLLMSYASNSARPLVDIIQASDYGNESLVFYHAPQRYSAARLASSLFSVSGLSQILVERSGLPIHRILSEGRLESLEQLLILPLSQAEHDKILLNLGSNFEVAVYKGHLGLVKRLVQVLPETAIVQGIAQLEDWKMQRMIRQGHFAVIQYLMALDPQYEEIIEGFWISMTESDRYWLSETIKKTITVEHVGTLVDLLQKSCEEALVACLPQLIKKVRSQARLLSMLKALSPILPVLIDEDLSKVMGKVGKLGYVDVFKYLETYCEKSMKAIDYYEAFSCAAFKGHLNFLQYLFERFPEYSSDWLVDNNYWVFRHAIEYGYLAIVQYLTPLVRRDEVLHIVTFEDFKAIHRAVAHGYVEIIQHMFHLVPDQRSVLLKQQRLWEESLLDALTGRHFATVTYFSSLAPEQWRETLEIRGCDAFCNYHLYTYDVPSSESETQAFFSQIGFELLKTILQQRNYQLFQQLATSGCLELMKYLAAQYPKEISAMIQANDYGAFRQAAREGHLSIVQQLVNWCDKAMINAMVSANVYEAFRGAAFNGHLRVTQYLVELVPHAVAAMVAAKDYGAFLDAIRDNGLMMLEWLSTLVPEEKSTMMISQNYRALKEYYKRRSTASSYYYRRMGHLLFSEPKLLDYAEQDKKTVRYGQEVETFVADYITRLEVAQQSLQIQHPGRQLRLATSDEGLLGYYCVRHLIRCNPPGALESLRFLLAIPEIRVLAHQAVELNPANALLKLAVAENRIEAQDILLAIPAVRALSDKAATLAKSEPFDESKAQCRPVQAQGMQFFQASLREKFKSGENEIADKDQCKHFSQ